MILQDDKQLSSTPIPLDGCFFMSALWHVADLLRIDLSAPTIIECMHRLQNRYVPPDGLPVLDEGLYVHNYDEIAEYFVLHVSKPAEIKGPGYRLYGGEREILIWQNGHIWHGTAGNGYGKVIYDPLGNSHTVQVGHIAGKVILSWEVNHI